MKFKKEKGITLVSLSAYVVLLMLIIGMIAVFKNNMEEEMAEISEYTSIVSEINMIHMFMLSETTELDNSIVKRTGDGSYIEFSSGNYYLFSNNTLYKNNIKIVENIKKCSFDYIDENSQEYLQLHVEFNGEPPISKYLKYSI